MAVNKNYTIWYKWTGLTFTLVLVLLMVSLKLKTEGFKTAQKKHSRVKKAYTEKEADLKKEFSRNQLDYGSFKMILVGYKSIKKLEVFVADKNSKKYQLFKTYDFCVLSGELGPKRMEGDYQVPEGLYEISHFNPQSNFHLSLKVNYPNASDKILSDKDKPGGDIYIHGSCVSVGCIPITDECIKELYILAVECQNRHQKIPVYIFPNRMTESNTVKLIASTDSKEIQEFWKNLKTIYKSFVDHKKILTYTVDKKGRYILGK